MLYRPKNINELRTAVELLVPTYSKVNGVRVKGYSTTGLTIYCDWKTYGGTETTVNGVFSVIDTAQVTCWYNPDIVANCRLKKQDGAIYEIVTPPENVEDANVYMQFKVERVKGGA